jgi:hypothetical protein
MPVIYWQPNAPRPTVPYITLFLASVVSVGQDWTAPDSDANGIVNMKGDRQFTLSIQAYGADPLTILENIRTSLQKATVLDTLRANGIAFYQALTINDITELVDSEWERRASLDVLFGIGQIYTDSPGFFDEVEVEETIYNEIGAVVYNETITITAP